VVLTSSTAACAVRLQGPDSLSDETQWTDLADPDLNPYRRSKTLAERAAWDFMAAYEGPTTLTTILPSAIFGPILSKATLGSVMVVGRILGGKMPGNPRVGFSVVDVRDLAVAQALAMTSPAAAGQRLIATNDFMCMADIARELRATLGPRAAKVKTRTLPDAAVRLAATLDASLRSITLTLGRRHAFSSAKAQRLLGWRPRRGAQTVVDCAESLLAHGVI
jgi:dihydroflavonol-4-reductase